MRYTIKQCFYKLTTPKIYPAASENDPGGDAKGRVILRYKPLILRVLVFTVLLAYLTAATGAAVITTPALLHNVTESTSNHSQVLHNGTSFRQGRSISQVYSALKTMGCLPKFFCSMNARDQTWNDIAYLIKYAMLHDKQELPDHSFEELANPHKIANPKPTSLENLSKSEESTESHEEHDEPAQDQAIPSQEPDLKPSSTQPTLDSDTFVDELLVKLDEQIELAKKQDGDDLSQILEGLGSMFKFEANNSRNARTFFKKQNFREEMKLAAKIGRNKDNTINIEQQCTSTFNMCPYTVTEMKNMVKGGRELALQENILTESLNKLYAKPQPPPLWALNPLPGLKPPKVEQNKQEPNQHVLPVEESDSDSKPDSDEEEDDDDFDDKERETSLINGNVNNFHNSNSNPTRPIQPVQPSSQQIIFGNKESNEPKIPSVTSAPKQTFNAQNAESRVTAKSVPSVAPTILPTVPPTPTESADIEGDADIVNFGLIGLDETRQSKSYLPPRGVQPTESGQDEASRLLKKSLQIDEIDDDEYEPMKVEIVDSGSYEFHGIKKISSSSEEHSRGEAIRTERSHVNETTKEDRFLQLGVYTLKKKRKPSRKRPNGPPPGSRPGPHPGPPGPGHGPPHGPPPPHFLNEGEEHSSEEALENNSSEELDSEEKDQAPFLTTEGKPEVNIEFKKVQKEWGSSSHESQKKKVTDDSSEEQDDASVKKQNNRDKEKNKQQTTKPEKDTSTSTQNQNRPYRPQVHGDNQGEENHPNSDLPADPNPSPSSFSSELFTNMAQNVSKSTTLKKWEMNRKPSPNWLQKGGEHITNEAKLPEKRPNASPFHLKIKNALTSEKVSSMIEDLPIEQSDLTPTNAAPSLSNSDVASIFTQVLLNLQSQSNYPPAYPPPPGPPPPFLGPTPFNYQPPGPPFGHSSQEVSWNGHNPNGGFYDASAQGPLSSYDHVQSSQPPYPPFPGYQRGSPEQESAPYSTYSYPPPPPLAQPITPPHMDYSVPHSSQYRTEFDEMEKSETAEEELNVKPAEPDGRDTSYEAYDYDGKVIDIGSDDPFGPNGKYASRSRTPKRDGGKGRETIPKISGSRVKRYSNEEEALDSYYDEPLSLEEDSPQPTHSHRRAKPKFKNLSNGRDKSTKASSTKYQLVRLKPSSSLALLRTRSNRGQEETKEVVNKRGGTTPLRETKRKRTSLSSSQRLKLKSSNRDYAGADYDDSDREETQPSINKNSQLRRSSLVSPNNRVKSLNGRRRQIARQSTRRASNLKSPSKKMSSRASSNAEDGQDQRPALLQRQQSLQLMLAQQLHELAEKQLKIAKQLPRLASKKRTIPQQMSRRKHPQYRP